MKLRNILLALTALYFFTRKKDSKSEEKTDDVLIEKKDDSFEVFDLEKKDIEKVSE